MAATQVLDASGASGTVEAYSTNLETVASIANLGAVDIAATFGAPNPAAGDVVLIRCAASRDGVEATSTAHAGLFIVGTPAAGIAPLVRTTDTLVAGTAVYVQEGSCERRVFVLDAAVPFVTDTTTQSWFIQPHTTLFAAWAFFSTGAWLAPSMQYQDQDWYIPEAGKESLWRCCRTATAVWQWVPVWSNWYGTTVAKPAAAVAYEGLVYYDTDTGLRNVCTRTGAATWAWVAIPAALALAGTGPVEVVAGAQNPSPAVLGAARTFRRVNAAAAALESVEQVPYLVDAGDIVGAGTVTAWSQAVAAGAGYDVRATVYVADAAGANVGVFAVQILVKRTPAGHVAIVDGPNVTGPDYLDAALAGALATLDVDVGTDVVRLRVTNPLVGTLRYRPLVQLTPVTFL